MWNPSKELIRIFQRFPKAYTCLDYGTKIKILKNRSYSQFWKRTNIIIIDVMIDKYDAYIGMMKNRKYVILCFNWDSRTTKT